MPSLSALCKFAVALMFTVWFGMFVASRVHLFFSAANQFVHDRSHAQYYCDKCAADDFLQNAGEYSINCHDACEKAHDESGTLEIGLRAVVAETYLCGMHPCEEMWATFNLKAILVIATIVYGMRYTAAAVTPGGSTKGPGAAASSLAWLLFYVPQRLFSLAASSFNSMVGNLEKADEVPKYHNH